jgi:cobalt/nickel transport system ATP-binding protein
MNEKLNDIHRRGATIFMATHDLDFVLQWADVVFVMHDGQIVMEGDLAEVFVQSDRLNEFQLGIPLLASVWKGLFPNERCVPRDVDQFVERWNRMVRR